MDPKIFNIKMTNNKDIFSPRLMQNIVFDIKTNMTSYVLFAEWVAHCTKAFSWNCYHHVNWHGQTHSLNWMPEIWIWLYEPLWLCSMCNVVMIDNTFLHHYVNYQQTVSNSKTEILNNEGKLKMWLARWARTHSRLVGRKKLRLINRSILCINRA